MRLAFSLWLTATTWIGAVVGLGFRPVGGNGMVSFIWVWSEAFMWICVGFMGMLAYGLICVFGLI